MGKHVITPGEQRRREGSVRRLAAKEVEAGEFVREAPGWWDDPEARPGEVVGWWDASLDEWRVLVRGEPRESRVRGWQVVDLGILPKRLLPEVEARELEKRYAFRITADLEAEPVYLEGGLGKLEAGLPTLQASYGREGLVLRRGSDEVIQGVLWVDSRFYALWRDGLGRAIGWEELFGMREVEKGGSLTRKRKGLRVCRVLKFPLYLEAGRRFFGIGEADQSAPGA